MKEAFLIVILISVAYLFISCSKGLSPEAKAIELVRESRVLSEELPVALVIKDLLKERKDEIKPIGWNVRRKEDQVYLVSYTYKIYSFDEGSGEGGYFFEVNLSSESVINVTEKYKRK